MVTKLLHIKRPRLIPICDSFVAATMEKRAWDAESTASLILAIREAGRSNVEVLKTISSRLESIGFLRPLVRILDVLRWFDAPYSGHLAPLDYLRIGSFNDTAEGSFSRASPQGNRGARNGLRSIDP